MSTAFQFHALAPEPFATLFDLSDEHLQAQGIRRIVVDSSPGYPCRVSLTDALVGETILALPFTHHEANSPYRASGPIFIRAGALQATPEVNTIPEMFKHRLLSIRAYDQSAMMVAAEVVEGRDLQESIDNLLARADIAYLHLHNARPGCYNCSVSRA
jgi:hypothetical protein